MIRITRRARAPRVLSGDRVKQAKRKLTAIAHTGRRPKSSEFASLWGEREIRESLWRMQHKKCCYCENHRDVTRESDVEHFRPKADVRDCTDAGYWWLAYAWKNLLFSCRYCNQEYKGNYFPLMDERARARKPADSVRREQPYLIDPSKEDPSQFIGFDWVGGGGSLVRPYGRDGASGRGSKTIEILGLDRLQLNAERAELLPTLHDIAKEMLVAQQLGRQGLMTKARARIRYQTSALRRFAGFAREYFRSCNLGAYVAND